jgi:acyl-CoA thioesterase
MSTPRGLVALLGLVEASRGPDGVVVTCTPTEDHVNAAGIVHGGFLAALLDTTTGRAADAVLPAGTAPPHLALSIQYVRATRAGTPLRCEGRVVRAGRTTAFAEARVTDAGGRVIATAASTHAVLRLDGA